MDPLTVLTTLWRHKWVALPVVLLTIGACVYVYLFAPRSYEATVSYALTAPDVPSNLELERDPDLAKLNSDNPYLRSNDSSLLAQVVITKLSDPAYVDQLKEAGLATDFKIAPVSSIGMGLVTVTATADSETEAVATAKLVGEQFTSTLYSVQKVNKADDRYLYSPILVRGPGPAKELFSSRLRSLIMVGIAGSVLLFGAVSLARAGTVRRDGKQNSVAPFPKEAPYVPSVNISIETPEDIPAPETIPVPRRTGRRASTTAPPAVTADLEYRNVSMATAASEQDENDTKHFVAAGEKARAR
ncbi:lipopolysaccharide biosynthesis protein [Pseudarthrobacter chlorophenolicus A6]|uniref:Lipopolysaccharide biosynthesis protein n=1 Tax=Pseudarthrobacter chlorophenolicus (strain ATCC 700700 / DSM 12829 / CIP 107037 / JCM 12360 / KCTC 9906 / NCIMB 13794 / A6) TaxID=452863 RepID=B8H8W3_PSECP|nr:lipopolysaccharide biosynthesis protein [Pseudarthrobacter chlorophenolicus]ACL41858.1 lipopolysaccharide biosynthesis protein [Pseudarthrobacter chlorophenolicus A6]SDQ57319.1 Chain length determinant protein [Pseudarthrobacter chlorophenolicus]